MTIFDLFVTGALSLSGADKYARQASYGWFISRTDLIEVNAVSGRNLLYRPVTAQGLKRYPGFERV